MRRIRIALFGAGGILALLVGCTILILSVLSSGWFKDQIRLRLITIIGNASGGTVNLKSFDYEWRTLTGELQGLVVHGTEDASEPPLLAASSVRVQLKITSLLKRNIDLEQLVFDRPSIYVSVRNDGTTNIPAPRHGRAKTDLQDQLIKLAVRHFEVRDGVAEVNAQRIVLNVRAQELSADVRYEASTPGYLALISSRQMRIQSPYSLPSATAFQARFQFSKDRIQVDQLMVSLPKSHVEGSGLLRRLADLEAGFQLYGTLDVAEMGELFKQPILRAGTVTLSGQATYERGAYLFSGFLRGRRVSCGTRAFAVDDAGIGSQILVNRNGITMSDLKVNAFGAQFSGDAQLSRFKDLTVNGRSAGLNLREISRLFFKRSPGFDGIASGSVQLRGRLGKTAQDFVVTAEQEIQPGSRGTPISGALELTYAQHGNLIQVGKAKLNLPNTSVDFSGIVGETLHVTVASTNLQDASSITALFTADNRPLDLPVSINRGNLNFSGTVTGPLNRPAIDGRASGHNILYRSVPINSFSSDVSISPDRLEISNAALATATLTFAGAGETALSNWVLERNSAVRLQGALESSDLSSLAAQLGFSTRYPIRGRAKITAQVSGTLADLKGAGTLTATGLNANGQRIDTVAAQMRFDGDRLVLEQGTIQSADAGAVFEGAYRRTAPDWSEGLLHLKLDTDSFRLQDLASIQAFEPALRGQFQAHVGFSARVGQRRLAFEAVDGSASLKGVSFRETPFGSVDISARTSDGSLNAKFEGNLRDSQTGGNFTVDLAGDYRSQGTFRFSTIRFSTIKALIPSLQRRIVPFDGVVQGEGGFNGPLARPKELVASVRLSRLEITPILQTAELARAAADELTLRNVSPIVIDYRDGFAAVESFRMNAKETSLEAGGRIPLFSNSVIDRSGARFPATAGTGLDFKVNGDLNLQGLAMFNPDLTANGKSRINATVSGTLNDPVLNGDLELHEASFFLAGLTNGIEHAEGLVRFDRNRATVQKLTAQSGGGNLSINGFISFGEGTPMVYRLSASAEDVRIRYSGVSITLDADLKYSGTRQSSALSGNLTVTKAAFNPSTDVGSLFAATSEPAATPRADDGFLRHVRLEVNIQSSRSLQLTTSLTQDVQADIDLHLRGSLDRPALLGQFSVNEGQIQFFGNKYTISRGEVNFFNPLKIQPELNLSLETQARGITVNITVNGTLDKLNVSYRSDPPLQSNEIISLLATGKAPDATAGSAGTQTVTQNSALGTGANTILGSAISPTSSRLERFFGVTHLKIDPMLQGIENVPQARLTMEQQISKQITITYVTNLSRTSEQIFRLEWAFSREYSVIAIRDENGLFGIDVQYRRRF